MGVGADLRIWDAETGCGTHVAVFVQHVLLQRRWLAQRRIPRRAQLRYPLLRLRRLRLRLLELLLDVVELQHGLAGHAEGRRHSAQPAARSV